MRSRVSKLITRPQREAIAAAVERALAPFAVPEPQTLPEWADEHFYLSTESSGMPGPWETEAYQRGLMLVCAHPDIPQVTIRKCARVGYTKILMALAAYWTAHVPRNGVLYQPTDSDAQDFVETEFDPMIRDVPTVAELMKGGGEKRSKENKTTVKKFRDNIWHILGGKSARAYRRLTKDAVLYDELDGFDRDIEGEGDPVTLGDMRITQSLFPKSIRGSTPADRATSIIQRTLEAAQFVFEWHFVCFHCAAFVAFRWAHLRWEGDGEPWGVCDKCGGTWTYRDLRTLSADGRWQTTAEPIHYVDDDGNVRDASDLVIEPPRHVGFCVWSGYSPFITWRQLRDEFLQAKKDPLKLKTFVNTRLGEPWEDDAERIDADSLLARREQYGDDVGARIAFVTIGVDVQDDRFEWQVTGWAEGEESWSLGYRRLYLHTERPDSFDALYAELCKPVVFGTRAFRPAVVAIDSGHRTDDVYRICRRDPRRFIPVKGSSDARAPYVAFPRTRSKKSRTYLTIVGVSGVKALLYARFRAAGTGDGVYHWRLDDVHGIEYFRQLVAEEKRVRYVKGHPVIEWWKPGGVGNEVLDCNVYAYAAMRIAIDYLGVELIPPPSSTPPAAPAGGRDDTARRWIHRRGPGPWLRSR